MIRGVLWRRHRKEKKKKKKRRKEMELKDLVGLMLMCIFSMGCCLVPLAVGLVGFVIFKSRRKVMKALSENRMNQIARLEEKAWWKATVPEIQRQVAYVPDEPRWNGFFEDLLNRVDEIGGLKVLRIIGFMVDAGGFGCYINFMVWNPQANKGAGQEQSYVYHSWRSGPASGAKGLVFVAENGMITSFLVMHAEKFATGGLVVDDAPGGFGNLDESGVATFLREIDEEIGKVTVLKVIDLGTVRPDAGLSNENPELFAAIIELGELPKTGDTPHIDKPEVLSKYEFRQMSEYQEFLRATDCGYSLMAAAKLQASGFWFNTGA